MRLKLITAPATEPISLDEAKVHLKVDGGEDNALISALITTARQLGESETKKAFITQTWELSLDFAPVEIEIPKPPLQATGLSIKVIDAAGAETIVDAATYDIDASENSPGRVKLRSGKSWPSHRNFASFLINFKAGYGDNGTDVPEKLKRALFLLIGHLYENRGDEGTVKARVQVIEEARVLFASYKIYRIR